MLSFLLLLSYSDNSLTDVFPSFLFQNYFPELILSFRCARDARDDVLVKTGTQVLEIEKKPLLYHNTNAYFKTCTKKVYSKPSYAENEDVESKNNVAITSNRKKLMAMLQQNSVLLRDRTFTENRHNGNP